MAITDVLTDTEAKTALNLTGEGHAIEVGLWVAAVSRRLDDLCGPVVLRTVTDETHDGGVSFVKLRDTPTSKTSATSITSVVEYDDTAETTLTEETNAAKPAGAFLFDRRLGFLHRRSSGTDVRFPSGRQNVLVTYQGGRFADTSSVDERFKLTASAILRRLWQREQGAWATGGDPFAEAGSPGFFKAMSYSLIREFLSDEMRTPAVA